MGKSVPFEVFLKVRQLQSLELEEVQQVKLSMPLITFLYRMCTFMYGIQMKVVSCSRCIMYINISGTPQFLVDVRLFNMLTLTLLYLNNVYDIQNGSVRKVVKIISNFKEGPSHVLVF